MKTRIITLAAALCGTIGLMAQSNQISLGVDLGLPLDPLSKEYTFLVGPTAGFELPIGDKLGITIQASYLLPQAKSDFSEVLSSASMLAAQAGLKYFFQESQKGFYGHAQLGIHTFTENFKAIDVAGIHVADAESKSETNMSWAIGAGYQLDKFDIGVRYNMIIPGGDAEAEGEETEAKSYIALRVAYLLSLGGKLIRVPIQPMHMNDRIFRCALLVAVLALVSCKKATDPRVHPSLTFKSSAGYTYADDTVPQQDTLLIGAVIDKTEDPLISLNISRAYDGGASSTLEDLSITGQEHVEHDLQLITRALAGTEKFSFAVLDRDGNVTLKSITLTVQ